MGDHRLTNERLRNWLDGNQPARERMCLSLLKLQSKYSDVRPRRPRGGPDGSRDIEAVYNGTTVVWGAVGFRNGASDCPEDRRETKKKFRSDLAAALKKSAELEAFVFFTNVDLRPSDERQLIETAKKKGILHVNIYDRERLRTLLDAPEGFAVRLDCLDIELSKEDQLSFFDRFGSDLEKLVRGGFQEVDAKLNRIEFFHSSGRPAKSAYVIIWLERQATPAAVGHFRILCRVWRTDMLSFGSPNLFIAGRDAYSTFTNKEKRLMGFGFRSMIWIGESTGVNKLFTQQCSMPSLTTQQFRIEVPLPRQGPFTKIDDFDRTAIDLTVTTPLVRLMAWVGFGVDDYVIARAPTQNFAQHHNQQIRNWPEQLTEDERQIGWTKLRIKVNDPSLPPPASPAPDSPAGPWNIDFRYYTSPRALGAGEPDRQNISL